MTNRVTAEYLADDRLAGIMAGANLPPEFRAAYGDRLLPRPFFLEQRVATGISDDLRAFYELLVSLPGRLFDGDVPCYAAALGMEPWEAELMTGARPPLHGRADLYRVGEEFKLLEFNVGSQLGGADLGAVPRALLEVEAFRDFAAPRGIGYVDPVERLVSAIGADRSVAVLEAGGALAKYAKGFASLRESYARHGLHAEFGELHEITERGGYAYLNGTRIDVVLRFFSPTPDDVLRRAHRTVVHTPLDSYLYGNKGTLSMLSQHREAFGADELALVDRLLPWTRFLDADTAEHCREHRADVILKSCGDFAGVGIFAGWQFDDESWAEVLAECAGRPFVAQERVVPTPELMPGSTVDWTVTWGVFVTEEGYAGANIRALPTGGSAVVSYGGDSETRVTGVFSYGP
jgi:hypothetical protein